MINKRLGASKPIPYTVLTYSVNGSYSFTVPPRVTKVKATILGAGGGGSGYGGSSYYGHEDNGYNGGRGGKTIVTLSVSGGQILSITVDKGGTKGASVRAGESYYFQAGGRTNGTASSVGSYSAQGGGGATGSGFHDGNDNADYWTHGHVGTSYGEGSFGGNGGLLYPTTEAQNGTDGVVIIEYGKGI